MAEQKFKVTSRRRFLLIHLTLHLLLVLGECAGAKEETFKNRRNLVLESFLPINFVPFAQNMAVREKRDTEGSGEGEPILSDFKVSEEEEDETDNSTQKAFANILEEDGMSFSNLTNLEGSGEVEDSRNITSVEGSGQIDVSSEEEKVFNSSGIPILEESEEFTTRSEEGKETTTEDAVSTEMIFDRSEDFFETTTLNGVVEEDNITTEATAERTTVPENVTLNEDTTEFRIFNGTTFEELTTEETDNFTTTSSDEGTTIVPQSPIINTTFVSLEVTTESPTTETPTTLPTVIPMEVPITTTTITETTETTTSPPVPPIVLTKTTISPKIIITERTTESPKIPIETTPTSTQGLPIEHIPLLTTPEPVVEEVFKEVKTIHKDLEASPGNILRKENLTLGADPLLIVNTRIMDSEENVQLNSSKPKRLGAYIVIGLILLSFSSLVGYITFRKRLNRKRREFESNQESHDTDRALLSLSDYRDNTESEENHLKNNEITPIVVKSNTQINKFEKNTNYSSPKNLNTIANEKNIEKDNVLKSTAENLSQDIIEDSLKVIEEDKNAPSMEKLIVKTRIDQDSIPKKPIIINRSSTGYIPIPQDYS